MKKINVLHFTKVINRNDFIDVIIRHANPAVFKLFASSYTDGSNIEDPGFDNMGVPYFSLRIEHGWMDLFKGAWRLSRILRKNKIEILHTHHYYESIIGRLACWLYPSCRHIIGRHYHDQFYLTAGGFKLWYYLFVENAVSLFSSAIIVPSTAIVELLKTQKVNLKKVFMIPYCFDFREKRFNPLPPDRRELLRTDLGWNNKFIIGNIARHHSIKGQVYLLQAFKQILQSIPEAMLVMIGDGPVHDELIKEANRLDISASTQFLGWRKDSHHLMNAMDVIVHPTLQEAFPQLMIEAMALAKPLIITPVSGATDAVRDRENGLIIPFRDADAIVKSVIELYNDSSLRSAIADSAYHFVRKQYTIEKIIPQVEAVYSSILRKQNQSS